MSTRMEIVIPAGYCNASRVYYSKAIDNNTKIAGANPSYFLSNYFLVRAEHQLGAFFGSRSACSQTLTPQRMFTYYCLNGHSDPPLKSIAQTSNTLRELSNILKQEIISGVCYYALNGKQIGANECKKAGKLSLINRRII